MRENTLPPTSPASELIPISSGLDVHLHHLQYPGNDNDHHWLQEKIKKSTNNELL